MGYQVSDKDSKPSLRWETKRGKTYKCPSLRASKVSRPLSTPRRKQREVDVSVRTETYSQMFTVVCNSHKAQEHKCPSTGDRINCSAHLCKGYSAMKRHILLVLTTTCANLKVNTLSARSLTKKKKSIHSMSLFP